jgi:hypothetical protein
LLIAALASLSTVSLPEELFFEDFATLHLLRVRRKTLYCRNGSQTRAEVATCRYVKGHRRSLRRCPSTWSAAGSDGRSSAIRAYEHPFPTS